MVDIYLPLNTSKKRNETLEPPADIVYFLQLLSPMSRFPRQHLRKHEVIDILISPICEVAGDTRDERNIECAPAEEKKSQYPQFLGQKKKKRETQTHSWIL